ncbi:MAG: DinB family protein [Gemmatimonadetes bacterium]|nr:DinB family protein [Gemmatimonadota bacterium]
MTFSVQRAASRPPRVVRTLEIFEAARLPLFAVLDGISRADLDWSPTAGVRGIGKICRHLYRVDIWFLRRLGVEPVTDKDGPEPAELIAERMRVIQLQIIHEVERCATDADLMIERTSLLDDTAGARLGPAVLHIAQHYMYHLAQITYLRRIRDPQWKAPLDEWEAATHLIEDGVLE